MAHHRAQQVSRRQALPRAVGALALPLIHLAAGAAGLAIPAPAFAALLGCAFLAGLVDAVAGGGGLIQVPALLVLLPGVAPAALFGTNKLASIWGTLAATAHYLQRVNIEWRAVLPAALAAFPAGMLGAHAVSALDPKLLRPLVLVLLLAVLLYTLLNRGLGALHAPRLRPLTQGAAALATGAALGFYDGFFGPGTGSFLVFLFVGLFGFSFLSASASAKVINVVTNAAALSWFAAHGNVLYALGLPMAACNVGGSLLGARLAVKHGSGFVRALFLVVVSALLLRLAYELRPV